MALLNAIVTVIFTDGETATVRGVYGFSYADQVLSRGTYRNDFGMASVKRGPGSGTVNLPGLGNTTALVGPDDVPGSWADPVDDIVLFDDAMKGVPPSGSRMP